MARELARHQNKSSTDWAKNCFDPKARPHSCQVGQLALKHELSAQKDKDGAEMNGPREISATIP